MAQPLPPETPPLQLNEADLADLAALADAVIPPSETYRVPGASDPAIVQGILKDARRRPAAITNALAALARLTPDGARYSDLPPADRAAVTAAFREAEPRLADGVAKLVAQAYYRDARVMTSLGMETRPPAPQGFDLKDGDWSLLEPVKRRERLYRPTS